MATLAAIVLAASHPALAAFPWSFTSQPTQCGNVSIKFGGGAPPYRVLVVPYGISPLPNNTEARKIQDEGPFSSSDISFKLNFPGNSQFVAVISDSTGFAAGGTSAGVLVTPSSDSSCFNASSNVMPDFVYSIVPTGVITQCLETRIWWDNATVQGLPTFQGVIPGGQSFEIPETNITNLLSEGEGTGFSWTPPLRGGTTLLLVAGDNRGNGTGGSTPYTVNPGINNDNSCLNSNSPSSTPGSPAGGTYATNTATSGGGGNGSGSSGGSNDNSGHQTNVGAIAGGTVGGVVLLIALALVILFFIRRRRLRRENKVRPDLLQADDGDDGTATRNELPQYYQPEPFVVPDPSVAGRSSLGGLTAEERRTSGLTDTDGRPLSTLLSESRSGTPDPSGVSSSTRTGKSAPMRQMRPVNIIQHADAGTSGLDQEPETVELPPAYTNIRK